MSDEAHSDTSTSTGGETNAVPNSPSTTGLVRVRQLLTRTALLIFVVFMLLWAVRDDLLALVRWPLMRVMPDDGSGTILLRVIDMFMIHLKLCFFASLLVVIPIITVRVWLLIRPRFKTGAPGLIDMAPVALVLLFFTGVAFTYLVVLPLGFQFLVAYSVDGGGILFPTQSQGMDVLQVSMREHVTLTMKLLIAFGLAFEAPLVMALSARLGVIRPEVFAKNRAIALVVLAIASSILTPPDPWTMMLLLGPLFLLYEFGIMIARMVAPKPQHDSEEAEKEEKPESHQGSE